MNKRAWAYVISVIVVGVALALAASLQVEAAGAQNVLVAILLLALATLGQLGKVVYTSRGITTSGTSWYTPLLAFMFAGVLVLPPYMLIALIAVPHLVEWAVERVRKTDFLKAWYIQPFNIATHIICALAAWEIYNITTPQICNMVGDGMCGRVFAAFLAASVYLVVNHYLVGQALVLACKITWMQSGVLNVRNTACDAAFLIGGLAISLLMQFSPLVIIPIILLMILAQRQMAVSLVKSPVTS